MKKNSPKKKWKQDFLALSVSQRKFLSFLTQQFELRRSRNPKYSIRSFANYLEVDQSLLTKVMKGERAFSQETSLKCLKRLNASESVQTAFSEDVRNKSTQYQDIDDDLFQVISEWYHFAILELMTIDGFTLSAEAVGQKLSIEASLAKEAIMRLKKTGFIEYKNEIFKLSRKSNTWFSREKTTEARKMLQKDLLRKSIESIDKVPFELREHNSVTLAVKKEFVPEIKIILQEANKKLTTLLQQTNDYDEVYQLTLSFFPLTKV